MDTAQKLGEAERAWEHENARQMHATGEAMQGSETLGFLQQEFSTAH